MKILISICNLTILNNMFKKSNFHNKMLSIGVLGVCKRIGTTTQAVLLFEYLRLRNKKVCYLELNNNNFIDNISKLYSNVMYDKNKHKIVFEKKEFYTFLGYKDIKVQAYDYIIKDYGEFSEDIYKLHSFFEEDIKIIVAGSKANEIFYLEKILKYKDMDFNYIFNFVPKKERIVIKNMLEKESKKIYFSNLNEDMFLFEEKDPLYKLIVGF